MRRASRSLTVRLLLVLVVSVLVTMEAIPTLAFAQVVTAPNGVQVIIGDTNPGLSTCAANALYCGSSGQTLADSAAGWVTDGMPGLGAINLLVSGASIAIDWSGWGQPSLSDYINQTYRDAISQAVANINANGGFPVFDGLGTVSSSPKDIADFDPWETTAEHLARKQYRVSAVELLAFAYSPTFVANAPFQKTFCAAIYASLGGSWVTGTYGVSAPAIDAAIAIACPPDFQNFFIDAGPPFYAGVASPPTGFSCPTGDLAVSTSIGWGCQAASSLGPGGAAFPGNYPTVSPPVTLPAPGAAVPGGASFPSTPTVTMGPGVISTVSVSNMTGDAYSDDFQWFAPPAGATGARAVGTYTPDCCHSDRWLGFFQIENGAGQAYYDPGLFVDPGGTVGGIYRGLSGAFDISIVLPRGLNAVRIGAYAGSSLSGTHIDWLGSNVPTTTYSCPPGATLSVDQLSCLPSTGTPVSAPPDPSQQVTTQPSAPSAPDNSFGLGDVVHTLVSTGDAIVNGIVGGLTGFFHYLGGLLSGLQTLLGQMWAGLDALLRYMFNGLVAAINAVTNSIGSLGQVLGGLLKSILNALGSVVDAIGNISGSILNGVKDLLIPNSSHLQSSIGGVGNAATHNFIGDVMSGFPNMVGALGGSANPNGKSTCGPTIGFGSIVIGGSASGHSFGYIPGFSVALPSPAPCPGTGPGGSRTAQDDQAADLLGYRTLVRGLITCAFLWLLAVSLLRSAPWANKSLEAMPVGSGPSGGAGEGVGGRRAAVLGAARDAL